MGEGRRTDGREVGREEGLTLGLPNIEVMYNRESVCAHLQGPVGGPPQPFQGSNHMVQLSKPSLHPLWTRPSSKLHQA